MSEKIAILGAGITGLTTAFYLKKNNAAFTVFEKENRAGGVIRSVSRDGFVWETGPNTGVIGKPEVAELVEDLGAQDIFEVAPSLAGNRYIWKKGKLHALPSGIISGLTTPLFSLKDKLGMPFEPFRPRGTDPEENLTSFVRRRLGQSILDYAVDPFVSGVYAGNPDTIIPRYALPKLYNLEADYGSFIRGAVHKMKEPRTERDRKATKKTFSAKGGLGTLVGRLVQAIGESNIRLGCEALQVAPENGKYRIRTAQGDQGLFDKVIFTFGATHIPEAFPFLSGRKYEAASQVTYAQVAEVSLGFRSWKGHALDGFGALVPSKEKRDILGALFMSSLFGNRAPEGGATLAVFIGGMRHPEFVQMNDDDLKAVVRKDVSEILSIREADFNPEVFEISRHGQAIPQYDLKTPARSAAFVEIERSFPGIFAGGNGIGGIGMADRIRQGRELASRATCNPGSDKNSKA